MLQVTFFLNEAPMSTHVLLAVGILLVVFLGLGFGSAWHYYAKERPKERNTD